ncbi:conserved hypothetical protein [Rippkaea orientalis PCC 8801]|uniref:Uncharacterized protein n=1 Tax=Rippkaea orientalis (strain PCC 8801 / RF-1) TaxID=41431 RepID=B7K621_RIPO1|nr:hypothetical protein [Rippkaea orientalis]ACK68074.1 conserved hypothetical protein [Rippkaea orientalis PCC 8801]
MSDNTKQLESIIERIGEAVLATTDTVESIAHRLHQISDKIEQQDHQIQQQGYQIFALTESIQTLVDSQAESREQLTQLTKLLEILVTKINS